MQMHTTNIACDRVYLIVYFIFDRLGTVFRRLSVPHCHHLLNSLTLHHLDHRSSVTWHKVCRASVLLHAIYILEIRQKSTSKPVSHGCVTQAIRVPATAVEPIPDVGSVWSG